MTSQRPDPGLFVRIPLADGSFGYGRVLEAPYMAFYKYRTPQPDSDLNRIASQPVLFTLAVNRAALKSWEALGRKPLEEQLTRPIVQFTQDILNPADCTIFDTVGNERAATPEECVGLESAAVWEQHHVEARLLDTFMGRPNDVAERMKVRLK
jgi:hypothetical protein